jgi:twitching motility protein PilT
MTILEKIHKKIEATGASAVFLQEGEGPLFRIEGRLLPSEMEPISKEALMGALKGRLKGSQWESFEREGSHSFLLESGTSKFRANLSKTMEGILLVLRELPDCVPDPKTLGLPVFLSEFMNLESGFLLFTGPVGSGKSTTLHSLVAELRNQRSRHVIFLEDPIEYRHEKGFGVVQQLEVGVHIPSLAEGVALSRSICPDILVVSDLDCEETVFEVLSAAESGFLVIAALHSGSTMQGLCKIQDMIKPELRESFRRRLSGSLSAVFSQVLLDRAYGTGKIPAIETLLATPDIRETIEKGAFHTLNSQMEKGRGVGMCTLDQALYSLVTKKLVTPESAATFAGDRRRFEGRVASPVSV